MSLATIKPILKYPGAKWNLAPWIISHFPAHAHYVEPFFGSGAVFFNKKPAKHEVINDLSGDVVNLFRVIREDGERLAALIEMTPWAREEYELSYQACDDPMERARRFVVRAWQGHGSIGASGVGSWRNDVKRNGQGKGSGCVPRWQDIPDDILPCIFRLARTVIDCADAVTFILQFAASDVLIYADPPYPKGERKDRLYLVDSMTDADHALLLDALDAHPGPVILSGYHCALYDDRLAHWHTREKQAQAEKGNTRTEVLWLNHVCIDRLGYGPMFAEQMP
jgi:DNA adenine methylase